MENGVKNIIIAGAGFGGITAALKLAKKIGQLGNEYRVILIDRHHHHLYTPALYEIAAIPKETVPGPELKSSILIPVADIIRGRPITFIRDEVVGLETAPRHIILKERGNLPYEFLIFALGSETNYFNIPGLKEYSIPLKTYDDAARLRNTIEELAQKKDEITDRAALLRGIPNGIRVLKSDDNVGVISSAPSRLARRRSGLAFIPAAERRGILPEIIKIVVGGGGASGVELVAELVNFICALRKILGVTAEQCRAQFLLIEAATDILPGFEPWMVKRAKKRLRHFGVRLKTGAAIEHVAADTVILRDGSREKYDVLAWAGGVQGPAILQNLGMPLSPKGTFIVNEYLAVEGGDGRILAVGDNASFTNPHTGKPLVWNVPVAEAEGQLAAENIIRALRGYALKKFIPSKKYPYILAIGGRYAIADLIIIRLSGLMGLIAKSLVELRYLLFILPIKKALKTWFRAVKYYSSND